MDFPIMKESKQYKNLLVVVLKDIFSDNSSSSLTIRSFLGEWDRNNIYQIVCNDFNSDPSGRVDNHTYHLGHDAVFVGSWAVNGTRPVTTNVFVPSSIREEKKQTPSFKSQLRAMVVNLYQELPYSINDDFASWLNEIHVDAIYTEFMDARTMKLVQKLSKRFGANVVPHIMDDWPFVYVPEYPLLSFLKKTFYRRIRCFLRENKYCLCISEAMCDEYRIRYGLDNPVPLMHSVPMHNSDYNVDFTKKLVLIYAGSLYLERHKSLLMLCKAIKEAKLQNCRLDIYCQSRQWDELKSEFSDFDFVNYGGFVDQTTLMQHIHNSDILVFIESFNNEMLKFTRFSMSTKIPEYLSSGKSIIAIGNEEQGSIKYLKKNNAAYVITNEDEFADTIDKLKKHDNIGEILNNANRLFLNNHEQTSQQIKFLNIINNIS